VQDVADRIGVSSGLIHYHFDNKDALLSAAFEHAAQRDLERLQRTVAAEPDAVAKLVRIVTMDTPEQAEAGWMLWIDAWSEALRNPILRQLSQDLDIAWKELLEAVIVEGVEAGTFTCADPHGTAWRLTALLDGLAVQVMAHDKAVSRAEMRRWILHAASLDLGVDAAIFGPR
jgi:AcrR family transcriptional regulator